MADKDLLTELKDSFSALGNIDEYKNALGQLATAATLINQTFTQGRTRIVEMQQAVADAIPGINRLGGEAADVVAVIQEVARSTQRNVIAGAESVERLYAASKLIQGVNLSTMIENFTEVGYTFEKIPDLLEDSIHYVQSIGGNASEVMETVVRSAGQLNRFQFEDGVRGLTKMAAQAAMLKFDMSETFQFADRVMDPEGAVKMASAFQRMGVAAGNLVDPFQLMNQSINDPSGLQTSLANVSKQFTYFDDKTKSFRISRQGVMILKEMESSAGLGAGSLSKMGIAAAELDARLSQISPSIKFANEEDKQYLANIATMNEKGEYVVSIKRPGGDPEVKKLTDVTQEETTKLIEEQKKAQKPLEEIQRDQLKLSELQAGDIAAIKNKILFGITSTAFGLEATEAYRKGKSTILGGASEREAIMSVADIRGFFQSGIDTIKGGIKGAKSGEDIDKILSDMGKKAEGVSKEFGEKFNKGWDEYLKKLKDKNYGMSESSEVEKMVLNQFEKLVGEVQQSVTKNAINVPSIQGLISGNENYYENKLSGADRSVKVDYDVSDLTVYHIVKPSPEFEKLSVNLNQFTFTQNVNESRFKQYIIDVGQQVLNGKSIKNVTAVYK